MPIQMNNNPETHRVIGGLFPQLNEDTYAADASAQSMAGFKLKSLSDKISGNQEKIHAAFQGTNTPDAFMDKLHESRVNLASSANAHMNLAQGLKNTATNIAVTKANMNAVDNNYHENLEKLFEWSRSNDVDQMKLNEEKNKLLESAQLEVQSQHESFDNIHEDTKHKMITGAKISADNVLSPSKGVSFTNPNDKFEESSSTLSTQTSAYNPKTSSDSFVSGTSPLISGSSASSFKTSEGSTSLSSASTLSPSSAQNTSLSGGIIPGAMNSAGGASKQAQGSANPMAGGGFQLPGMAGASTSGSSIGSVSGGAGAAGLSAAPRPVINSKADSIKKKDIVPNVEKIEGVGENNSSAMEQALIIWNDLMSSGWQTGVAVAGMKIGEKVTYFYATDIYTSIAPSVMHADVDPIDTWDITTPMLKRLALLNAVQSLEYVSQISGVEIVSRASVGIPSSSWPGVSLAEAFRLADPLDTTKMSTRDVSTFVPENFAGKDLDTSGISEAETVHSSLVKATMAKSNEENSFTDVMPDGSNLSYAGYLQNALKAKLIDDREQSINNTARYYAWQSSIIDGIR